MTLRYRSAACVTLLLFVALGTACSTASKARAMFGGKLPFHVAVAPDANENSAIAVDLLVVYDGKLVDQLLKMRAADWFVQKAQFVRDHPKQLMVHGWEWVPSQSVGDLVVPYDSGAKKIVLFADYATDGDHRAVVDPQQPFRLTLGPLDFALEVKQ
jgi:type VI secretion system protein